MAGPSMQMPPWRTNDAGDQRRVGVELEFAGIDLVTAADAVWNTYGGEIAWRDAHSIRISGTDFGNFEVELDSDFAHPSARSPTEGDLMARTAAIARAAIGDVIEHWMPREIVTPPMPIEALPTLDELCRRLRNLGAVGTDASWRYAFSVQLNPEVPSLACDNVLTIFRSFLLLSDWLRAVTAQSMLRRALPFAQPFPRNYVGAVLAAGYRPDWPEFIHDYLTANPTRNRDLDLCPLMAHVDEARVHAYLDDPRIKARPTFHYRLPDSRIEDPAWSVITEWNRWVAVERLAADPEALAERTATFVRYFIDAPESHWVQETSAWLERHPGVLGLE